MVKYIKRLARWRKYVDSRTEDRLCGLKKSGGTHGQRAHEKYGYSKVYVMEYQNDHGVGEKDVVKTGLVDGRMCRDSL